MCLGTRLLLPFHHNKAEKKKESINIVNNTVNNTQPNLYNLPNA